MENNKKMILALGFSLAIMASGASYNVLAMEQPCKISSEIVELHKRVAEDIKSLNTPASFRLNKSPIALSDFLTRDPLEMLYHLQYVKDWLHIQLVITQSNTQVPGAIDPWDSMQYEKDHDLLLKVNKLFDLIKNSCDIKNKQINEIENQLSKEWKKEDARWPIGR